MPRTEVTRPMLFSLPPMTDPIWAHGHALVSDLVAYINEDGAAAIGQTNTRPASARLSSMIERQLGISRSDYCHVRTATGESGPGNHALARLLRAW